ncbi:MAG: glycosyltransferase family 1 protein [Bryobacteraceae bacterium]|jgi:glycosyltransferase involved in cell wall biosynthesis
MRITIDALPLLFRSAGVKNYLYYWTRHLQRQPAADVHLFPALGQATSLDHRRAQAGHIPTLLRLGLFFLMNRLPAGFSQPWFPATDVFHSTRILYPPRRAKLTATIHDLTCWLLPDAHLPATVAFDQRFAEQVWKRADGLIAVSESSRDDAARLLGIPREKMEVIYPGVPEPYFSIDRPEVRRVRDELRLRRPYLLYVGTIEPRKNVDLLLDAYGDLASSISDEFDLVIAGSHGWASRPTMRRLRSSPPNVRYLGYVPESDLPALFAGAAAFVYPSLYEGFGFPVAQAMAAGVPVIASGVSSLPEITGDAAVLIDPRSRTELRDAIERLLTSPSRLAELSKTGRTQARKFSWPAAATRSLDFFARVVGGSCAC